MYCFLRYCVVYMMMFVCCYHVTILSVVNTLTLCVISSHVPSWFHYRLRVSPGRSLARSCECVLLAVVTTWVGPNGVIPPLLSMVSRVKTCWLFFIWFFLKASFNISFLKYLLDLYFLSKGDIFLLGACRTLDYLSKYKKNISQMCKLQISDKNILNF